MTEVEARLFRDVWLSFDLGLIRVRITHGWGWLLTFPHEMGHAIAFIWLYKEPCYVTTVRMISAKLLPATFSEWDWPDGESVHRRWWWLVCLAGPLADFLVFGAICGAVGRLVPEGVAAIPDQLGVGRFILLACLGIWGLFGVLTGLLNLFPFPGSDGFRAWESLSGRPAQNTPVVAKLLQRREEALLAGVMPQSKVNRIVVKGIVDALRSSEIHMDDPPYWWAEVNLLNCTEPD